MRATIIIERTPEDLLALGFSPHGPNAVSFWPDVDRPDVRIWHAGVVPERIVGGYRLNLTAETLVCAGNA